VFKILGETFIGPSQPLQLCLHLDFQSGQLGLVAALALLSESLQGLTLALVGLLAQGVRSSRMRTSSWSCSWRFSCRRWSQRRRTSRKAVSPIVLNSPRGIT
jgi:hypothetical protein